MEIFSNYINEIGLVLVTAFILFYLANIFIVLALSNRKVSDDSTFKNGSIIGNLERTLIFIGVVIQGWTLIGIIVALKTVARYKKLDGKDHSEYFLIGSMVSILVAISVGLIFVFLVKETDLFPQLKFLISTQSINVTIVP
ncbi:MAG: hypothetical protein COB99_02750 [Sulfurimonas sp.]|nr:MAG: hypothetical protein COB99_02750 [Sulfurimonas sp.]